MIGVIAKLKVKPGMEEELEKHPKALVEKVNARNRIVISMICPYLKLQD